MALMHEPTAPDHSTQDALRVLETVARHTTGVTDSRLARLTGIDPERLTTLLRMLRREGYVEQVTDGAYVIVSEWRLRRSRPHAGGPSPSSSATR